MLYVMCSEVRTLLTSRGREEYIQPYTPHCCTLESALMADGHANILVEGQHLVPCLISIPGVYLHFSDNAIIYLFIIYIFKILMDSKLYYFFFIIFLNTS